MHPSPRIILYCLASLALGLSCYIQFEAAGSGDKDWLMYAANMVLNGKKLDVDIIEINPPLIIWLYTIPNYVAAHIGVTGLFALIALGLCVVLLSIFLNIKLLWSHPLFIVNGTRRSELVFLLAFVLIFRTDPSYFIDRDHLFLVLTLPYTLRWLPSIADNSVSLRLRILVGIMAGIGFCIKPHCLILLGGIQMLYFLQRRSFRILYAIENLIIYAEILAYLGSIWHYTPEYLNIIFPMALATYGAFSRRIDGIIYICIALFTLAVALCEFRPRYTSPLRRDIYYLTGICAFLLGYGLLNNGWGYSYNPLISYVLITVCWLLWEFNWLRNGAANKASAQLFIFGVRASATALSAHGIFSLALIIAGIVGIRDYVCEKYPRCMLNMALQKEMNPPQAPPRSFLTLSPVVGNWSALSRQANAPWDTRFNCLWMLHKFFISDRQFMQKNAWILAYTANALADDITRLKPEIVFADSAVMNTQTRKYVDLPAFFSAYPAFKSAWLSYRYAHAIDYCGTIKSDAIVPNGCRFDIYYRIQGYKAK